MSEWMTPVTTPEVAYLSTRGGELLSFTSSGGTERRWSPGSGASVVTDDVLHVVVDGETATLSRDDGKEVAARFVSVPHARAREVVLVSDEQGRLVTYNTDEERQLWTRQTPEVQVSDVVSQGVAAAVPVDDVVYVAAANGFHGLEAAQG